VALCNWLVLMRVCTLRELLNIQPLSGSRATRRIRALIRDEPTIEMI
jgi:hypothetical protein